MVWVRDEVAPTARFRRDPRRTRTLFLSIQSSACSPHALPARVHERVGRQPVHEAEKREKRRGLPLFCKTKPNASYVPFRATTGVEFIDEIGGGHARDCVEGMCLILQQEALISVQQCSR